MVVTNQSWKYVVRSPGFEPGLRGWKPLVLTPTP